MKKPEVHFRSRCESGNIYFILGMVRDVLRKQRRITDYNNLRDQVLHSSSYAEALRIIREKVNLIDDDNAC